MAWEDVNNQAQGNGQWIDVDQSGTKLSRDQLIDKAINYANEYNIRPDVYLSLIKQESGFNPTAKSPTGVRGISQMTLATGKGYGINNESDRSDPDKMLKAGAWHLSDLLQQHGDYPKAVLAYNGGSDKNYNYNVGRHLSWARGEIDKRKKGAESKWVDVEPGGDVDPVTGKTWTQLEAEFQPVPLSDKDRLVDPTSRVPVEDMLIAPEAPAPLGTKPEQYAADKGIINRIADEMAQGVGAVTGAMGAGAQLVHGRTEPITPEEMAAAEMPGRELARGAIRDLSMGLIQPPKIQPQTGPVTATSSQGGKYTVPGKQGQDAEAQNIIRTMGGYIGMTLPISRALKLGGAAVGKVAPEIAGSIAARGAAAMMGGGLYGAARQAGEVIGQGQPFNQEAISQVAEKAVDDALFFGFAQFGLEGVINAVARTPDMAKNIKEALIRGYYRLNPQAAAKMEMEQILDLLGKDPRLVAEMARKVPKVKEALIKLNMEAAQKMAAEQGVMQAEAEAIAAEPKPVQPPAVNMAKPAVEPLFTPKQMKEITHEELLAMPPEQQKIFKQQLKELEAEKPKAPKGKIKRVPKTTPAEEAVISRAMEMQKPASEAPVSPQDNITPEFLKANAQLFKDQKEHIQAISKKGSRVFVQIPDSDFSELKRGMYGEIITPTDNQMGDVLVRHNLEGRPVDRWYSALNVKPAKPSGIVSQMPPEFPVSPQVERTPEVAATVQAPKKVVTEAPKEGVGEGIKEPWEMTNQEYLEEMAKGASNVEGKPVSVQEMLENFALHETRRGRPTTPQQIAENHLFGREKYLETILNEGKPVPPEVLADYPDLAEKYQAELPRAEGVAGKGAEKAMDYEKKHGGPSHAPKEDVLLFEKLNRNKDDFNKSRISKSIKQEIIKESKSIRMELIRKGYSPAFIKSVEMDDVGIPIPLKDIDHIAEPRKKVERTPEVAATVQAPKKVVTEAQKEGVGEVQARVADIVTPSWLAWNEIKPENIHPAIQKLKGFKDLSWEEQASLQWSKSKFGTQWKTRLRTIPETLKYEPAKKHWLYPFGYDEWNANTNIARNALAKLEGRPEPPIPKEFKSLINYSLSRMEGIPEPSAEKVVASPTPETTTPHTLRKIKPSERGAVGPDLGKALAPEVSSQEDNIKYLYGGLPPGPDTVKLFHDVAKSMKNNPYFKDISQDEMGIIAEYLELPFWRALENPEFRKVYEVQTNRENLRNWMNDELLGELEPAMRWWKKLPETNRQQFRDAVWHFDNLRVEPDDKGLQDFGLDPEAIQHYRTMREVMDYIWDEDLTHLLGGLGMPKNDIDKLRRKRGKIAGFFPHLREGRYFVSATSKGGAYQPRSTKAGKPVIYQSEETAKKAAEFLNKKKEGEGVARAVETPEGWTLEYRKKEQTEYFELFDDIIATLTAGKIAPKAGLKEQKIKAKFPESRVRVGQIRQMPEEAFWHVDTKNMQAVINAAIATAEMPEGYNQGALREALLSAVAKTLQTRGFGSHFISRKDVPGFDKSDPIKNAIRFIQSYNGFKTKLLAARGFTDALKDVDPKSRDWKFANKYVKDMLANSESLDKISDKMRAGFFVYFLGGVARQILLQPTQNFIAFVPAIQQYTKWSSAKISAEMAKVAKDVASDTISKLQGKEKGALKARLSEDEFAGLETARKKGVISDQLTREYGTYLLTTLGRVGRGLMSATQFFIGNAEIFNRQTAYVTAYRVARNELGKTHLEAMKFAEKMVEMAHFRYGKANLPPWTRGGDLFKLLRGSYAFRSYNNNLLRLYMHLGTGGTGKISKMATGKAKRGQLGVLKGLLGLMAFGGLTSLYGYKYLEKYIQEKSGKNIRSEITKKLGGWSKLISYGLPAAVGIDLSGSMSIEAPRNIGEVIGVPYALGDIPYRAGQKTAKGDYYRALETIAPSAFKGPLTGARLRFLEGMTTSRGKHIKDAQGKPVRFSTWDFILRSASFRTVTEAEAQRRYEAQQISKEVPTKMRQDILDAYRIAVNRYGVGSKEAQEAKAKRHEFNKYLRDRNITNVPKLLPMNFIRARQEKETKYQKRGRQAFP